MHYKGKGVVLSTHMHTYVAFPVKSNSLQPIAESYYT